MPLLKMISSFSTWDEHRILATGSLRRHIFDSQNLANHTFDAHV
jgi:hypothetical protein